jgi:hypothetical protein
LYHKEIALISVSWEAGWVPEPFSAWWQQETFLFLEKIEPIHPAYSGYYTEISLYLEQQAC